MPTNPASPASSTPCTASALARPPTATPGPNRSCAWAAASPLPTRTAHWLACASCRNWYSPPSACARAAAPAGRCRRLDSGAGCGQTGPGSSSTGSISWTNVVCLGRNAGPHGLRPCCAGSATRWRWSSVAAPPGDDCTGVVRWRAVLLATGTGNALAHGAGGRRGFCDPAGSAHVPRQTQTQARRRCWSRLAVEPSHARLRFDWLIRGAAC